MDNSQSTPTPTTTSASAVPSNTTSSTVAQTSKSKSKYNLRNKKLNEDKKYALKNSGSSDDEDDYSDIDSDYVPGTSSDEPDMFEYRKFLAKLYPSRFMCQKVKSQDDLKHAILNKYVKEDDDGTRTKGESDKYLLSDKESVYSEDDNQSDLDSNMSDNDGDGNGEDDEEAEDDDYEYYDSEDEEDMTNLLKNGMKFNIVLSLGGNKFNDEYDDEVEDEEDDEDDELCAAESDQEQLCESDPESEQEPEPEPEPEQDQTSSKKRRNYKSNADLQEELMSTQYGQDMHRRLMQQLMPESVSTRQSRSHSKYMRSKDKDKNVDKHKSKTSPTSKSDEFDETAEQAFREMLTIFKKKKQDASSDAFNVFEKYLNQESEKLKERRKKEEQKKTVTNLKKLKKMLRGRDMMSDFKYFKTMSLTRQQKVLDETREIEKHRSVEKPYRITLIESPIPPKYKSNAMSKINSLRYMEPGSGEYYKVKQWVDTFMRVPFGKYKQLPIKMSDGIDKCNVFMEESKNILDKAVYGLDDAKMQIMQMMGQWISNPDAVGTAIAIKGPMGTGKTTLIKEGVSKCLDRPFAFISLGGATDSSFLEGHSYTYEGSMWGKIIDIVIQSKCMNPVIYFDELDKVSNTAKGDEIIGILTHLTDTTQNSQFHDKYFADIDFDLSKVLFIFSYNDEAKVNPILRDRMYRIETTGYNTKQKIEIAHNYLIPAVEKNVNFKAGEINISDEALTHIITELTDKKKGVRNLKRCIEIIYTKLNLYRLMKPDTKLFKEGETLKVEYPFTVTQDVIGKLIKKNKEEKWYLNMYT